MAEYGHYDGYHPDDDPGDSDGAPQGSEEDGTGDGVERDSSGQLGQSSVTG